MVPWRLIALKTRPSVTVAAVIHLSTALFTHTGIGTVRTAAFSDEIHDCPVSLPDLDVFSPQTHQFGTSQSASEQVTMAVSRLSSSR
jgi:hypothetical protein